MKRNHFSFPWFQNYGVRIGLRRYVLAVALGALWFGIAGARAAETKADYRAHAKSAAAVLQTWYEPEKGTWRTTGWWNSANALEALLDYTAFTKDRAYVLDAVTSYEKIENNGVLNGYYDDEGWWALTWLKAYDLLHQPRFLTMAKTIFEDMKTGWDTKSGGVWWNKEFTYKNAIPNELFLTLAARLHQRTPGDAGAGSYLDWANREWTWFAQTGMINSAHLINDGLDSQGKSNGGPIWTYNQGVILGGLVELYRSTGQKELLKAATEIADAAISKLITPDGLLVERCEAPGNCDGDSPQFKGIFVRNLGLLYSVTHRRAYREFLRKNADALWDRDRNTENQFGVRWGGPFDQADAARQTSALDALNAVLR